MDFLRGIRKVKIQIRVSPNHKNIGSTKTVKNRGTGVAASRQEHPLSTNVSSPIQAASRRRNAQHTNHGTDPNLYSKGYATDDFVISDGDFDAYDEPDESSDDAFEAVRDARKPTRSKKRTLGPPITSDDQLEKLDPTHRFVVDDFLIRAKKESEKVRLQNQDSRLNSMFLLTLPSFSSIRISNCILLQTRCFEKWQSTFQEVTATSCLVSSLIENR